MKKVHGVLVSAVLAVSFLSGCSSSTDTAKQGSDSSSPKKESAEQAAAGFVPQRDFEFVVPYSAGGGSDTNARVLSQVITENKFTDKQINVVNKPGGSGAVGNAYTFGKKGDPYTIQTWVSGQAASAVVNKNDVTLENLTPIATMAVDSFLVSVNAESKYKTLEELIQASKDNPDQIAVGGSGAGNEDHLLFYLINQHTGAKFKYVTFNSGGETTSALLGGHIDVVLSNPNEIGSQIEAGKIRALATSSAERLPGAYADLPTIKELGYPDVVLEMYRGIVGPPDMPAEAVKYWSDIFKKVSETKDWQENYIQKYSLQPTFKDAAESKEYFTDSLNQYIDIHKALGTIK